MNAASAPRRRSSRRKCLAGVLAATGNDEPGAFLCESDGGRAADAGQRHL